MLLLEKISDLINNLGTPSFKIDVENTEIDTVGPP